MNTISLQPEYSDRPIALGAESIPKSPVSKNRNIRVLHVINGEHYSGAERVQDLLAGCLPEFGFDVGFVCVKPGRFADARQFRTALIYATAMRSKFDLRVVRQVVDRVRADGYSLIHAHTPRSALVARLAAMWARVPFVYHVHSPTARDSTHHLQNKFNHWTELLCLRGASALVTVSHSLRQYMVDKGYPPTRTVTVPNGVPSCKTQRSPNSPTGTWNVGTIALFRPRKGIEVLLDAIAMLKQEGVPVRLQAVGAFETADYEHSIRARAADLKIVDSIDWCGFTTDVAAALSKMDLFVLPSLFGEGLPMVVLEAMAAGVPVVATRVEGVPEAIEHGANGLLARPNDATDLANSMRSMIRGEFDWSGMRQAALSRHAAEFSDRRMAERLAEVYRSILPA